MSRAPSSSNTRTYSFAFPLRKFSFSPRNHTQVCLCTHHAVTLACFLPTAGRKRPGLGTPGQHKGKTPGLPAELLLYCQVLWLLNVCPVGGSGGGGARGIQGVMADRKGPVESYLLCRDRAWLFLVKLLLLAIWLGCLRGPPWRPTARSRGLSLRMCVCLFVRRYLYY